MSRADQVFDSRAMPLAEPSTAPSAFAFALWRWFGDRLAAGRARRPDEADAMRDVAPPAIDPRLASEQRAADDLHELRRGR